MNRVDVLRKKLWNLKGTENMQVCRLSRDCYYIGAKDVKFLASEFENFKDKLYTFKEAIALLQEENN